MVDAGPVETFPFGRPVLRRRASAKSKRRVFVLGMCPGALHIAWWSPARKLVKALPVENEPESFWTGADERDQIAAWKRLVGFRLGDWGEVETSDEANGAAGRWLDQEVLGPLGVTRDEACLSTCLQTYLADHATTFMVEDRYQPWAREAGHPLAHLAPRPRDGAVALLAIETQRERLLHELSVTVPEIVITLGNVALRVLKTITDCKAMPKRICTDATYGAPLPLVLGKRTALWMALTHVHPPLLHAEAHARWRSHLVSAPTIP